MEDYDYASGAAMDNNLKRTMLFNSVQDMEFSATRDMLLLDSSEDFYDCIGKFEQKAVMTDAARKKSNPRGTNKTKTEKDKAKEKAKLNNLKGTKKKYHDYLPQNQ